VKPITVWVSRDMGRGSVFWWETQPIKKLGIFYPRCTSGHCIVGLQFPMGHCKKYRIYEIKEKAKTKREG
jgi:hypothetical protein